MLKMMIFLSILNQNQCVSAITTPPMFFKIFLTFFFKKFVLERPFKLKLSNYIKTKKNIWGKKASSRTASSKKVEQKIV